MIYPMNGISMQAQLCDRFTMQDHDILILTADNDIDYMNTADNQSYRLTTYKPIAMNFRP